MSWYIHPSKQLRDDELPPELVVTNRDGSIEQVYVPYNASDQLEVENVKLREELAKWERLAAGIDLPEYPVTQFKPKDLERENDKLREQLDVAEHNQTRNAREYARLCHENDKLRELVQDIYEVMWACAEQRCTHRHDGCFRVRGNHGDICVSERCWYEDRMSELGIEV